MMDAIEDIRRRLSDARGDAILNGGVRTSPKWDDVIVLLDEIDRRGGRTEPMTNDPVQVAVMWQATCDSCGWHTPPTSPESVVREWARLHRVTCPLKPAPPARGLIRAEAG